MTGSSGRGGPVREAGGRLLGRLHQVVGGVVGSGPDGPGDPEPRSRWLRVTVNRGPDDVLPGGELPAPLAALGDAVEVEVRPAPGGKGTELSARLREGGGGGRHQAGAASEEDGISREQVRSALREAKQLIEVGEVLRLDPVPHGRRPPTPGGAAVESATRHTGGEGVL